MKKNLDISTQVFGANILLTHLQAFEAEIEGFRNNKDIEAVHRMRVASRRLRCTLPLFSASFSERKAQRWLANITEISDYLGEVRDYDVQIDYLKKQIDSLPNENLKPGFNRLILRLSKSQEKIKQKVLKALECDENLQMIKEMNKFLPPLVELKDQVYLYTPSLYNLSFKAVTSRLDHFLAFEEFIFQPEKVKEIHAMRTSNKWLRYTCETFAPLYSDELKHPLLFLRKTQEALGELHDCDLWIQYLPVFMEKEEKRTLEYFGKTRPYRNLVPGLEYLLEQKQKERLALYQVFVETWQNSQAENIWGELRQAIQAPFSQQVDLSKQPNSTSSVQEP